MRVWVVGLFLAGSIAGDAAAQTSFWQGPVLPGLRRIDEGGADSGPLSSSQRVAPTDLRIPTGFQGVYQFDRPTPFGRTESMFARSSGGLTAVFPRSVYIESRAGLVPEIPAGTVFMIGRPQTQPAATPARSPLAVDLSLPAQGDGVRLKAPVVTTIDRGEPLTIWNSERLRQQRLGRLLDSVAGRR